MKKLSLTIATVLLLAGATVINAQDDTGNASHDVTITIPTLAIVDIETELNEPINLAPTFSNMEAGAKVDFSTATDNSSWLNYTSIIRGDGNANENASGSASVNVTHKITAQMTTGTLPSGMSLKLTVAPVTGGIGIRGTSEATNLTLTDGIQNVVTGIESCYTGNGVNAGHQLTYKLAIADTDAAYANLLAKDYNDITITYTISE